MSEYRCPVCDGELWFYTRCIGMPGAQHAPAAVVPKPLDLTSVDRPLSLNDIRDAGYSTVWVTPGQMYDLYDCLADPPSPSDGLVSFDFCFAHVELHPTYREIAS